MGIKGYVLIAITLGLLVSCRQDPASASRDSNQPPTPAQASTSQPPRATPATTEQNLPAAPCPEIATWSVEDATAKLTDEAQALCAAIRLVQLQADTSYLADDEERADFYPVLGLGQLDEQHLVLGIIEIGHKEDFWSPWLISVTGEVEPAGDPNSGPNLVRISSDPSVFPHLIVTPEWVSDPTKDADSRMIELEADQPVRFAVRYQERWPYVALVLLSDPKVEAARYRWMPYETMFHGPIYDDLPAPTEGTFHVNLEASEGLEPVGGKIPPPIAPAAPPGDQSEVLPI